MGELRLFNILDNYSETEWENLGGCVKPSIFEEPHENEYTISRHRRGFVVGQSGRTVAEMGLSTPKSLY